MPLISCHGVDNVCKVHSTLKTSPAIAAGLTDRVWSIRKLLEKTEPTHFETVLVAGFFMRGRMGGMKQFSLKALVAFITLIALFLGYSQSRRQTILRECKALEADAVQFVLPDALGDKIWQRFPTNFVVMIKVMPDAEEDARIIRVRERLNRMGAKDVRYMAPAGEAKNSS
jgi:hypothetical protein